MARPKIEIDPEQVEYLACLGLNETQICAALNISLDTFRRRRSETPGLYDAAIARGRARGVAAVSSALFEKALNGDIRAQTFYLKNRGGWQTPYSFGEQDIPVSRTEALDELVRMLDRVDPPHPPSHAASDDEEA